VVRGRAVSTRLIGTVTWVPWFLPGILLSLGLLWAYLANPFLRPLFGSLLGLILAIIIREMPFAVQILRGAFGQLGSELEDASRISGASWFRTFLRVVMPIGAPVVLTVGVLIALAAIRDVSTIILLSTQESRPLSILVLQFSTFGEIEAAAVTGLMMSAIVLVGALVGQSLSQRYAPR
jgi:iron(III) transport system permease protein